MNQHFVPRVYLKNFGSKRKKDYYVDVYDKSEERFFNTNIKNICAETDLYTLPDNSTLSRDRYVIEKFFSQGVEPMYDRAYKLLVDDNVHQISRLQRIEVLIGLFQLYSRNPFLLKDSLETHRFNIERLYSESLLSKENHFEYLNHKYDLKVHNKDSIIRVVSL